MYSDQILNHFQSPRFAGELAPPAVTVRVENPVCGDILQLSVRWEEDVAKEGEEVASDNVWPKVGVGGVTVA